MNCTLLILKFLTDALLILAWFNTVKSSTLVFDFNELSGDTTSKILFCGVIFKLVVLE